MKYGNHEIEGYVDDVAYDGTMLAKEEAILAEGAPFEVEEVDDALDVSLPDTSWMPTRKWMAATVTALVGLVTLYAQHGWHVDEHTTIATATIIGQRAISYLIPNKTD